MEIRNDQAAKDKLVDLIKDAKIAMLTTRHQNGSMHSRPMGTIDAKFDGHLWFFTYEDNELVEDVKTVPDVNVSYSDEGKQNYVSVTGQVEVLKDPAKVKELWSEPMRTWFPKGADDPRIAILQINVHRAQYWDAPSSTMLYAYGYVKALATGEPPKKTGENVGVTF